MLLDNSQKRCLSWPWFPLCPGSSEILTDHTWIQRKLYFFIILAVRVISFYRTEEISSWILCEHILLNALPSFSSVSTEKIRVGCALFPVSARLCPHSWAWLFLHLQFESSLIKSISSLSTNSILGKYFLTCSQWTCIRITWRASRMQISWPYPKIIWVVLRRNMHFISISQKHKTASSDIFRM